jgi:hypothetical protein
MAICTAIVAVAVVRLAGFVSIVGGTRAPLLLGLQYVAIAATFILGFFAIHRGLRIEPPAWFVNFVSVVTDRIARRFATP